ncbi:MAG: hypothetical protein M1829_003889 [Trizodia sp. TS-e1964]|nr:MAG: hypothetical protein M1829_003889 [Trizodia sp. TS-e1964]
MESIIQNLPALNLGTANAEPEDHAPDRSKGSQHASDEGVVHHSGADDIDPDASAQKLREAGWVGKVKFDYDTYNATNKENQEKQEAENSAAAPTWAANAKVYEWDDEYGDVGPPLPELERELFGSENVMRTGDEFENLKNIEVTQEGVSRIYPIRYFEDAGLHPIMLQNVKLARYNVPTPIQAYCIPAVLEGNDVVASAQTGSGKTAAFLIPILSKLMGKAKKLCAGRPNPAQWNPEVNGYACAEPLVLIVAPTRELATQIFDEARRFCYRSMLRPCVIYGGSPARDQRDQLSRGCDVLVATPGRLCDFMDKPHILTLKRLKYTVIDEADEMLHGDWEAELKKIMSGNDTNQDVDHSFMMFSATFPKGARQLAKEFLANDHVRIRVGRAGSSHVNVTQNILHVDESNKRAAVRDLLYSVVPARTIIFVNSKRSADLLDDYLYNLNFPTTSVHADRTQREREDAIRAFRSGKCPILVATGVSARGLDIRHVMHVINFDLPSMDFGGIEEYVHRIGRTARIGNTGIATSFYNAKRNEDIAPYLVKLLMETKQTVPDFLEEFRPVETETGDLDFDDNSDEEEESEHGSEKRDASEGEKQVSESGETVVRTSSEEKKVDKAIPEEEQKPQVSSVDGWGTPVVQAATSTNW